MVLYLVAWTTTLEGEISDTKQSDETRTPWAISMTYLTNILQSLMLLLLGYLLLKLLNMIHFTWILSNPESVANARLGEVFSSVHMVLKQSLLMMIPPLIVSLVVTNLLDWILRTFTNVGIPPVTVLVCNLIFIFTSFFFD